ncbi:MAG: glutamate-1-semialdehyde 2,1-aminomutase [Maricaulaceae bacterium]|jgi:glutamate-1-semialdehyde 2,1-aminomutase
MKHELPQISFEKSRALREKAHRMIPGGAHTTAKGDDQYPVLSPGFVTHGQGCHVWDADGNEFIEYNMGNRAVGLGHAYAPILDAVRGELDKGVNFSRPATIEVEAAEAFLAHVPGADMVKFCKDGSRATSAAVRVSRAVTGRDKIAICSDHPWFSGDDWFIGTMVVNAGVPKATQDLTVGFRYNDIESVKAMFAAHEGEIAGVILEPTKGEDPKDNFLHELKRICHENGALFILDEMISGLRWANAGGQERYDIVPDLSTWGKSLANGFSVSALAGKREFMELGGLEHDKERVMMLSSTHGGETHALAAMIATLKIYQTEPVIEHYFRVGERLRAGVAEVAAKRGLEKYVQPIGAAPCLVYAARDPDLKPSQAYRSLFLQETIKRGVLVTALTVSYSHTDADIDQTIEAIDGALGVYAQALDAGDTEGFLVGRPSRIVNRKYNHKD